MRRAGRAPIWRAMTEAETRAEELDRLRTAWRAAVGERLPDLARVRPEWPIRLDHCFSRVILDAVHGRPWREVLRAPAWRNMDAATLRRAIALAEDIADGRADLEALNRRSLVLRGEPR